jgi:ribonuclease-3 family protein
MDVVNGLTLAYLGDSYYELKVRTHLVDNKWTDVNDLHKKAITYTSGSAQANIMAYFIDEKIITEDEYDIFKRGRNASGRGRGNIDAKTYAHATGFEALIGHLYLNHQERADELIIKAIQWIEKG